MQQQQKHLQQQQKQLQQQQRPSTTTTFATTATAINNNTCNDGVWNKGSLRFFPPTSFLFPSIASHSRWSQFPVEAEAGPPSYLLVFIYFLWFPEYLRRLRLWRATFGSNDKTKTRKLIFLVGKQCDQMLE